MYIKSKNILIYAHLRSIAKENRKQESFMVRESQMRVKVNPNMKKTGAVSCKSESRRFKLLKKYPTLFLDKVKMKAIEHKKQHFFF